MKTVCLYVILIACAMMPRTAIAEDFLFVGRPPEFQDYGYFVRGSVWQFNPGAPSIIFVCWENPTPTNEDSRGWVRDQILATWGRVTPIEFKGWAKCAERNSGIRIIIADGGPHVKAFGRHINGLKDGMLLNDTFHAWNPSCGARREACVRSIAVHEFGHAIGFAHEQNRPDTPGECWRQHGQDQGKELPITPYDVDSVMNYCNVKYNNNGNLSLLDVKAAQAVYGGRKTSDVP